VKTLTLLFAALLLGCGTDVALGPPPPPGPDGNGGGGGLGGSGGVISVGGSGGAAPCVYPVDNVGNQVGQVLPPLSWNGYVNDAADSLSTTKTWSTDYGTEAIYCQATGPYALIHTAWVFCPGCRAAARALGAASVDQNLNGAVVVAAGGIIVEVLIQSGYSGGALDMFDITTWVNTYDLDITTMMAVDAQTEAALIDREWSFIIDTSTMQIVWRQQGSQVDGGESSSGAYSGMTQMMLLLGQ